MLHKMFDVVTHSSDTHRTQSLRDWLLQLAKATESSAVPVLSNHCYPKYLPIFQASQWRVTFRITAFLDFAHHPEFRILENTMFQKPYLFPSSGEGRETHTLLGPFKRVYLLCILVGNLYISFGIHHFSCTCIFVAGVSVYFALCCLPKMLFYLCILKNCPDIPCILPAVCKDGPFCLVVLWICILLSLQGFRCPALNYLLYSLFHNVSCICFRICVYYIH
jgi:hypothetical protein